MGNIIFETLRKMGEHQPYKGKSKGYYVGNYQQVYMEVLNNQELVDFMTRANLTESEIMRVKDKAFAEMPFTDKKVIMNQLFHQAKEEGKEKYITMFQGFFGVKASFENGSVELTEMTSREAVNAFSDSLTSIDPSMAPFHQFAKKFEDDYAEYMRYTYVHEDPKVEEKKEEIDLDSELEKVEAEESGEKQVESSLPVDGQLEGKTTVVEQSVAKEENQNAPKQNPSSLLNERKRPYLFEDGKTLRRIAVLMGGQQRASFTLSKLLGIKDQEIVDVNAATSKHQISKVLAGGETAEKAIKKFTNAMIDATMKVKDPSSIAQEMRGSWCNVVMSINPEMGFLLSQHNFGIKDAPVTSGNHIEIDGMYKGELIKNLSYMDGSADYFQPLKDNLFCLKKLGNIMEDTQFHAHPEKSRDYVNRMYEAKLKDTLETAKTYLDSRKKKGWTEKGNEKFNQVLKFYARYRKEDAQRILNERNDIIDGTHEKSGWTFTPRERFYNIDAILKIDDPKMVNNMDYLKVKAMEQIAGNWSTVAGKNDNILENMSRRDYNDIMANPAFNNIFLKHDATEIENLLANNGKHIAELFRDELRRAATASNDQRAAENDKRTLENSSQRNSLKSDEEPTRISQLGEPKEPTSTVSPVKF